MSTYYYLQLKSTRSGGIVNGYGDDADWAGWIPVRSAQFGPATPVSVSSNSGVGRTEREFHEIQIVVNGDDLDVATLIRWAADAEPCSAVLNQVPDAVGKNGVRWGMSDALVINVQTSGMLISFTINFEKLDRRESLRFR